MTKKYKIITYPLSEKLSNFSWFNECIFMNSSEAIQEYGENAFYVPEDHAETFNLIYKTRKPNIVSVEIEKTLFKVDLINTFDTAFMGCNIYELSYLYANLDVFSVEEVMLIEHLIESEFTHIEII